MIVSKKTFAWDWMPEFGGDMRSGFISLVQFDDRIYEQNNHTK